MCVCVCLSVCLCTCVLPEVWVCVDCVFFLFVVSFSFSLLPLLVSWLFLVFLFLLSATEEELLDLCSLDVIKNRAAALRPMDRNLWKGRQRIERWFFLELATQANWSLLEGSYANSKTQREIGMRTWEQKEVNPSCKETENIDWIGGRSFVIRCCCCVNGCFVDDVGRRSQLIATCEFYYYWPGRTTVCFTTGCFTHCLLLWRCVVWSGDKCQHFVLQWYIRSIVQRVDDSFAPKSCYYFMSTVRFERKSFLTIFLFLFGYDYFFSGSCTIFPFVSNSKPKPTATIRWLHVLTSREPVLLWPN